jgi:protein-S-isoprenylcysteine O-methyltransferase Ste14
LPDRTRPLVASLRRARHKPEHLKPGRRTGKLDASSADGELLTRAPCAIVRNRIYASELSFTWTAVAVHLDVETVVLGLAVTAAMVVRVFEEQRSLRAKYAPNVA